MELQSEFALVGPSRGVAPSDGGRDEAGGGPEKEQLSEEGQQNEGTPPQEDAEPDGARGLLPVRGCSSLFVYLFVCLSIEAIHTWLYQIALVYTLTPTTEQYTLQ